MVTALRGCLEPSSPGPEGTVIDSLLNYTLLATGSLLAVLNPLATVPLFLAMTATNTVAERRAMAKRAATLAFAVLSTFALLGLRLLSFFGVGAPAFQIAGGLVLIRVAFDLVHGGGAVKVTPEERAEGTRKEDISVTPLAVPLLCGPATITAAILVSSQAESVVDLGVLLATIALIYFSLYFLLRFASDYSHRVGDTTIKVSSRLMGLMLIAVGVQFVLEGIRTADLLTSGS